jgi:hypothetical protein
VLILPLERTWKAEKVYTNTKHTEKQKESPEIRKTSVDPCRKRHDKKKKMPVRVIEIYR